MRRIALLAIALIALSGCMQSEVRFGPEPEPSHDHCWFFCGTEETHVHYDFFPLTVFMMVLGVVVVGIIIAAASGRDGGQQQQQQVVIHQRK